MLYIGLPFASILSYIFIDETMNLAAYCGCAIIVGAAILVVTIKEKPTSHQGEGDTEYERVWTSEEGSGSLQRLDCSATGQASVVEEAV